MILFKNKIIHLLKEKKIYPNTVPKQVLFWNELIQFYDDNNWFDIHLKTENSELRVSDDDFDILYDKTLLFLLNKNLSTEKKIEILITDMKNTYPITAKALISYNKSQNLDSINFYYIADFLMAHISKEINLFSNENVEDLVRVVCRERSLENGKILLDFLTWFKKKHRTVYSKDFILNKRKSMQDTISAYDKDTYLKMIYYLFNEDYIQEHELYQKACTYWRTANTWLYLCLNCICALRTTDIEQIPHPKLNSEPNQILNKIEHGNFSDMEARMVCNSILWQLNYLPIQPSKTKKYSNIPSIKLLIPESAIVHFGILFAINEAHFQLHAQKELPFIIAIKKYEQIERYLTEDIAELFIEQDFSSRRANKTYMQAIELLSNDFLDGSPNGLARPKGYMLAALARSHKGGYGEFSHTTEVYLKDANFSGYTPEFIAKELFERGVCSFVPSMLLKMVTSGVYDKLSIQEQTSYVKELSLTPLQIEDFISANELSVRNAVSNVNMILEANSTNYKEVILEILQNIATGAAASKTNNCMCLMTATKNPCKFPERLGCVGCGYEISTKATIFTLLQEYNRLMELKENTTKEYLKEKYKLLLTQTLQPILNEYIINLQNNYGNEAVKELELIIKEIAYGK